MKWKTQKGQTSVEYIMLFAVAFLLVGAVFKSKIFNDFMGPNGKLFVSFKNRYEYSYTHALPAPEDVKMSSATTEHRHESYWSKEDESTRFFTLLNKYPRN